MFGKTKHRSFSFVNQARPADAVKQQYFIHAVLRTPNFSPEHFA
jgi:hypothetical protein